jgi:glycosyltransferase involved in cell wall biosynthesis
MARVAIDATAVSPEGKGISRVAQSAARALVQHGVDLVALVGRGVDIGAPAQEVRARPALLWEQLGLRRAAREHDVVLTFTDRLPVAGRGRFLVWLFELPRRRIARNRGAGAYQRGSDLITRALWKRSLRAAATVAVSSQATLREVEEALPELAGQVQVVYPGVERRFCPGHGADGAPYVFHLGSADPRDNPATIARAFALSRSRSSSPMRLVVAGELGAARHFKGVEGVELRGRVSEEELVELYRGACAYLDATLSEGFGYQALEALACGTPFVGSNTTSVPEVVGDAGLLADPRDAVALAAALVRVVEEPAVAEDLRRRGIARARTFTWERSAAQLAALVEEAAG